MCVYACVRVSERVCVCVCAQVSQHVNRTAYFSLLSPQGFLLNSSYYIVLHPASPSVPIFCQPHSLLNHCTPFTHSSYYLHFSLYFLMSCHVFNDCFPTRLLFQSLILPHFFSQSQTPAEVGVPVKQRYWCAARQVNIRVSV